MKIGRFTLAIAMVFQVRARGDDSELEKNLREAFARLPEVYEELYPAVENCTEVGAPDVLLYGVATAVTVPSSSSFNCYKSNCLVYCSFKWLRATFRSRPGEIFFENKSFNLNIDTPTVTQRMRTDFLSGLEWLTEVRAEPGLERSEEKVVEKCARKKLENYDAVLSDVIGKIGLQ